jgi:hypothetical protein
VPWVKALLSKLFGLETVVASGKLRFVVIDGSTVQVSGATETSYRLHIAIDLVKLALLQVEVSTDKVGESLAHYRLGNGDVVIIDRGYNQPKSLVSFVDQGGDIVLRYNPHGMNLYQQTDGMATVDWGAELKNWMVKRGHFQCIYTMAINASKPRFTPFRYQKNRQPKRSGAPAKQRLKMDALPNKKRCI